MQKQYPKTALLTTSSAYDVLYMGATSSPKVQITGLNPFRLEDLADITIKNARAEVAQVNTIGGTTDPTIAYSTKYRVAIKRQMAKANSNYSDYYKVYTASISASQGSAALDRQAIYDSLTAKINADSSNGVVASAGTGGTAMTITDDGSYYTGVHNAHASGRGIVDVELLTDPDTGNGFVDATHREVSTEGVYALGTGAQLLAWGAGHDLHGSPVSESRENKSALSGASTGQLYTYVSITTVQDVNLFTGAAAGGWNLVQQELYVDNGAGTSTTNAAGYLAFLRQIEHLLYGTMWKDVPNAFNFFFEEAPAYGGITTPGGATTGTTNHENSMAFVEGTLRAGVIGTQTITVPSVTANGVSLVGDATANEGFEIYPSPLADAPAYKAQSGAFSFRARIRVGDISETDTLWIGFRSKQAFDDDFTAYTDMVAIGLDNATGDIHVRTRAASGSVGTDDIDATALADGVERTVEIRVGADGVPSVFVDDIDYTSGIASNVTFASTLEMIPFATCVNGTIGASGAVATIKSWYSIPDIVERTK